VFEEIEPFLLTSRPPPGPGPFQPICSPKRRGSKPSSHPNAKSHPSEDSAYPGNCRLPPCRAYNTRPGCRVFVAPTASLSHHTAVVLLRGSSLVEFSYYSISFDLMADSASITKGAIVQDGPVSPTSSTPEPPVDRAAERRLVRKLDLRILPVLWLLYLVNFIDR
jgi:hypothetical protein